MGDLSRLSNSEQQVLRLLAEGHTAKSIASELGLSQGAVNDRLRSARKKAGVGSSRELARWLRTAETGSPETGAEKIGLSAPRVIGKMTPRSAVSPSRWSFSMGALALVTLASGIGAFLALALAAAPDGRASPPHVVSTYPANNAQIEPGTLTLRVTFDRPMNPGNYSFIERDKESFPTCAKPPTQSTDGRTFTLECLTEAHRLYVVGFNEANHHNFTGAQDGATATPSVIHFSTR
jgi:DNA-binding CsgD family transcriptional regulator